MNNFNKKCEDCKNTQDAARKGHLECLEYAHENGCPWDEKTRLLSRRSVDLSNFTMRERDMYNSLMTGRIPESCKLDQLGIKVENKKIVTPGVILRFQHDDIRHITVFLDNEPVGNIFYAEEANGFITFILTNINK